MVSNVGFLFDAKTGAVSPAELAQILEELERLRTLYAAGNPSFDSYSEGLSTVIRGLLYEGDPGKTLPLTPLDLRRKARTSGMALPLSALASLGGAIDGYWAFQWYLRMEDVRLKAAATRCPEVFQEAFIQRFSDRYPAGLEIKTKDREFSIRYHPASGGLRRSDLQHVSFPALKEFNPGRQRSKVKHVGEEAQEQIDGYSRRLGRGDGPTDPWALAELPMALASGAIRCRVHDLAFGIGNADRRQHTSRVSLNRTSWVLPTDDAAEVSQNRNREVGRTLPGRWDCCRTRSKPGRGQPIHNWVLGCLLVPEE